MGQVSVFAELLAKSPSAICQMLLSTKASSEAYMTHIANCMTLLNVIVFCMEEKGWTWFPPAETCRDMLILLAC